MHELRQHWCARLSTSLADFQSADTALGNARQQQFGDDAQAAILLNNSSEDAAVNTLIDAHSNFVTAALRLDADYRACEESCSIHTLLKGGASHVNGV